MRKLFVLGLLISSPAYADCDSTKARYDALVSSGDWVAIAGLDSSRKAQLFGQANSLLQRMKAECNRSTAEGIADLDRQIAAAINAIAAYQYDQRERAVDHSLTCGGWSGFMSCN